MQQRVGCYIKGRGDDFDVRVPSHKGGCNTVKGDFDVKRGIEM